MTANLVMLSAFAVSILLTLACVLLLRWLRARQERRSPMQDRQVGHVPGQQLVHRVAESQDNMLLSIMIMYFAFPVMLLAWALQRVPAERFRFGGSTWLFLLGAILMFIWGFRDFFKHLNARQSARDGLLAERVTGMQLNRLMAKGCLVMHDVPSDTGNIDHVVIAPRGVYVVETKSFRKPRDAGKDRNSFGHQVNFDGKLLQFPDFKTDAPIIQSLQHADWLRRALREAIKLDVPVIATVALPGWFGGTNDEGWRTAAVKVFSPLGEGANFMVKDIVRISPDQRSLIATALAQRFPLTSA